jgi:16S rRNA (cytosine1402-N4)-methyltransferase
MMVGMSNPYHKPVLLKDCIEFLDIRNNGVYVDLTFGGGGHSSAIMKALGEKGKLFAFDQDEDAQRNVIKDKRFTLVPHNFRYLKNYLRLYGVTEVDGILGDLGVSSHQFDEAERGFSIRSDAQLDMRMNRRNPISAMHVLNEYSAEELKEVFREYGEIREAGRLTKLICEARDKTMVTTTFQLSAICAPLTQAHERSKFLAKVFQALRIEVNDEMSALRDCLNECPSLLKTNGRLVMISYHSLEDRMVKDLIRSGNAEGKIVKDIIYGTEKKIFKNLTSKPVTPEEKEIAANPRARSARLRAAVKL